MRYKLILLLGVIAGLMVTPVAAQLDDDDRLLVWTAPVTDPTRAAQNLGGLGFVTGENQLETFLAVPEGANRIQPCGHNPLSPNGRYLALYMGNDSSRQGGNLYIMTEGRSPQQVATIQSLGCIGANGRFMYSPNSEQFGYIAYKPEALQARYASGDLKIRSTANFDVLKDENTGEVVSFDLTDDGAAFINFIPDAQGNANEASLSWWDGSSTREIMNFRAGQGCRYTSGLVRVQPDAYWVALGEGCNQREWQLYRVEKNGSNAVVARQEEPRGGLFTSSETNNVFFSQDGNLLFYTLPSGLDQNTATLLRMPLNDFRAAETIIEDHIEMPTFRANVEPEPVFAYNGEWLALVSSDGTRQSIQIISLTNAADPISLQATNTRSETVQFLAFTPDSRYVVFVAGGEGLRGNYISRVEVGGANQAERFMEGAFSGWAVMSPDTDKLAILEWQERPADRPSLSSYLNLILVDVSEGSRETLYEGIAIDGDNNASTRFARPLYWFR